MLLVNYLNFKLYLKIPKYITTLVHAKVLIIFSLKKSTFHVDLELHANTKYKDSNDSYNHCRKDIKIDD